MPACVSDEVLHLFAVVGTHEEIAAKLLERFGDVITHCDVSALGVQDAEGLGYHPDRNTLLVPDGRSSTTMIEVSLGGTLLTTIDISSAQSKHPEDVAVAPATSGGGNNLFMVARGVDNNSHPNENDGKMYEFSVSLPSMGNNPPVVNAGPDQSVQFPDAASLNGSVTDDGKPTPSHFHETVRNLKEIAPTIHLNVPKGFEALAVTLPAVLWVARMFHDRPPEQAITLALTVVDDHVGFNRVLAGLRQRLSFHILARSGQLARLIAWYSR